MKKDKFNPDYSARNGLFDRRSFLKASIASGSGMMIAGAHASEDKIRSSWMGMPGEGMGESGPSEYERHIKRADIGSQPGTVGSGASRTPIQFLDGIITPSRLHFERHHSGIPNINPDEHRLVIHGLVKRQLSVYQAMNNQSMFVRISHRILTVSRGSLPASVIFYTFLTTHF